MAQERPGMTMTWKNLSYCIGDKKADGGKKWILYPQDGEVKPRGMLALMGPSGSGKTSLLNSLAGRLPITKGASFCGALEVNGICKSEMPCPFADISAYVEQEDVLYALSTAQETLEFAARLRLSAGTTAEERNRRIDESLRQLGLVGVRNTNVGGSSFNGALRGLSGGERKRLSIALELLHEPSIIFLDEPTSGLDSYQALNVMEKLRALADVGHTVIVSIHQPRSSIYSMFTGVYLMAAGKPVYTGSADDATDYFSKLGHLLPPKFNPADFLIDLVSIDQRGNEELEKTQARLASLQSAWEKVAKKGVVGEKKDASLEGKNAILAARSAKPAGQTSLCAALPLLIKRGWREQMRDKLSIGIKIAFSGFFAMIFALVYFRMGHNQSNIQDRVGLLFFTTMNQAFGAVIGCAQVIPRQVVILNRERANRLYSILPFYLSCMIVMVPIEAVPQLITSAILFYMANLGGSFWIFFLILVLENLVGISFGMFLSALFKNVQMASQLAPAVVIFFLMFGGQLINENSVPVYFSWLKEISFIRYAFKAVAVNELQDQPFTCDAGAGPQAVCVTNGNQVLDGLGFLEDGIILKCILILLLLAAVMNVLAFLTLLVKKPRFLSIGVAPTLAVAASIEGEEKGTPV